MITIIGTAHISRESISEVRSTILELNPDVVAVELDEARYKALLEQRDIKLSDLKKGSIVLANVLLSFLQRKFGEEVGVKPGKEMLTAIETAREIGVPYALIDRDIKITLGRAMASTGFLEKLRILKEMLSTFSLTSEDIEKEIESIKKAENVSAMLENLKSISPNLFRVLVSERDAYMAKKIIELQKVYEKVLVVIGAGHKKGIEEYLSNPEKNLSLQW